MCCQWFCTLCIQFQTCWEFIVVLCLTAPHLTRTSTALTRPAPLIASEFWYIAVSFLQLNGHRQVLSLSLSLPVIHKWEDNNNNNYNDCSGTVRWEWARGKRGEIHLSGRFCRKSFSPSIWRIYWFGVNSSSPPIASVDAINHTTIHFSLRGAGPFRPLMFPPINAAQSKCSSFHFIDKQ